MIKAIHNLTERNRINYIDATRGIAILSVVIGHLVPIGQGIGQYLYSFHMPIFFIISGMLMFYNESWKSQSLMSIASRKAKSLLFPYFSFSILSLVYILIRNGLKAAIEQSFVTLFFDGILTLWFLPALYFAEILFYVMMTRMGNKQRIWLVFFIIIVTTLFSFLNFQAIQGNVLPKLLPLANIINRALIGSVFVFVGYWYGYLKSKYHPKNTVVIVSIIIAFSINIVLYRLNYVDLHYSIIGNPILYYVNAILGSYAIINLSEVLLCKSRLLCFMGKNSIVIFATHLNLGIIDIAKRITVVFLNHYSAPVALLLVLLIETVLILVVNKYGRILIDYNEAKRIIARRHI